MKERLSELAIFGGEQSFGESLHVGRPNIGDRELLFGRLNDILDRRWLTNAGTYVKEFERRLAEMIGVRHCIPICNATVGLEIAIRSLGMEGEVIVPSFTFIATPHALQWQEITPVFCDIDPITHNLDPVQVERMITPRTTGIIGVHVWGKPCDIDVLEGIARKHHLKLLFDAAHAFGCSYKGRMIGGFGDAEVFSFHATKFFNTFEGGAIATNDDELAKKIRLMKNFGFAGRDEVIYIGTNGKMSEVSAAMGLTGLESLKEFINVNRCNYYHYLRELAGIPGIRMVAFDEGEKLNFQYIILEVDQEESGITRDQLVTILHSENVLARRYFYPGCHQMEPYRSYFPHAGLLLPVTEKLVTEVMSLPTGTAVSEQEIDEICHIIRLCVRNSSEVTRRLEAIG
ncbi:MAG: dTDP-4-dehydro-6-deoxyglucose aminotransferase [Chloroflexi bacterium RBG_19FT_COMBO_47_9]|nr:MAG: dTDP-4-dehydro-6-deoxyglucose aminotransferase [Chloroflexi bacterium RBG_19FT_COMBO_47_9]